MANPRQVREFSAPPARRSGAEVRAHRPLPQHARQGLANVLAALEAGYRLLRVELRRAGRLPRSARCDRQHRHRGPRRSCARWGSRPASRSKFVEAARAAQDVLGRKLGSHILAPHRWTWRCGIFFEVPGRGRGSRTTARTGARPGGDRLRRPAALAARRHVAERADGGGAGGLGGGRRARRRPRPRARRRHAAPAVRGGRLRRLLLLARARHEPRPAVPPRRRAAAAELAPPARRLPRPRRHGRAERDADRAAHGQVRRRTPTPRASGPAAASTSSSSSAS